MELLSFYFSTEYYTLREFIPEIAPVFDQHKLYISESIAIIASASIKISRARKDALRPLFNTPSVLRHDPTASSLLGGEELATLSEKASKEQSALKKVFRPVWTPRTKFKFGRAGYNKYQRNRFSQKAL